MFFGILLIFTGSPILNPTLCFVTVLSIAFSSYIIADMDAPYTGRLGVSPGLVLELAAVVEDLAQSGGGGEGGGEGGGASPAATASIMPRLVSSRTPTRRWAAAPAAPSSTSPAAPPSARSSSASRRCAPGGQSASTKRGNSTEF